MGTALLVREELPASEGGAVQECAVAPESVLIRLHVWRHRALGSEESAGYEKKELRELSFARVACSRNCSRPLAVSFTFTPFCDNAEITLASGCSGRVRAR